MNGDRFKKYWGFCAQAMTYVQLPCSEALHNTKAVLKDSMSAGLWLRFFRKQLMDIAECRKEDEYGEEDMLTRLPIISIEAETFNEDVDRISELGRFACLKARKINVVNPDFLKEREKITVNKGEYVE